MDDKLIFAIDFDGTIVENEWPFIGGLKPYAKEVINALYESGHYILIWTCRSEDNHTDSTLKDVVEYLNGNSIYYDDINKNIPADVIGFAPHPKIYADIYIDDRQLGGIPDNWLEILDLINVELNKRNMAEVKVENNDTVVYPVFEYVKVVDNVGIDGLKVGTKLKYDPLLEAYEYNDILFTIDVAHAFVQDYLLEYGGALITDTEFMEQEKQNKNE